MNQRTDPFGAAVSDYYKFKWRLAKIKVTTSVSGDETINPKYLFRSYSKMSEIEQKALDLCEGKVLDVGACAGSHSEYLQAKNLDVLALDISSGCCEVMKKRGIKKVLCKDYFQFSGQRFDTIFFMMNGIGIAGTLEGLKDLLRHTKTLLNKNGQVLFDSSDIDYCYYEDDGSKWVNLNSNYYGEVNYKLSYKKVRGKAFSWLFVDETTMAKIAEEEGFSFDKLAEGKHYDYLGRLKLL
ncbi:MAG: methyltransferase domain-containing protein [Bacteroidales bacterium]|nr:methyltransferase domain-containing protein [Bacteroidales bacterium]MBN2820586.1 methyltransferase domain-containing protein [Bacteroidales bacterium]